MKTVIKVKVLKIDQSGYHLITTLKLNGKSARVVIDTGASHSVFDIEGVKKFLDKEEIMEADKLSSGLGTNSMKSMEIIISRLEIGKIKLENQKLVLLDLQHVTQSYVSIGQKPVDGVIGSDLLKLLKAVINFGDSTLTVSSIKNPSKVRNKKK